ncbi:unnamed protein product [Cercospora beticola]|nr:unnamed protein product [Cercospora beticola]
MSLRLLPTPSTLSYKRCQTSYYGPATQPGTESESTSYSQLPRASESRLHEGSNQRPRLPSLNDLFASKLLINPDKVETLSSVGGLHVPVASQPTCKVTVYGLRRGSYHIYKDGYPLPAHIFLDALNLSQRKYPRKRLLVACVACRKKKIKCEPGPDACLQCKKGRRECKIEPTKRRTNKTLDSTSRAAENPVECPSSYDSLFPVSDEQGSNFRDGLRAHGSSCEIATDTTRSSLRLLLDSTSCSDVRPEIYEPWLPKMASIAANP